MQFVVTRTCQHLRPLEEVFGADLDGVLGGAGGTSRTSHLVPLRVLCNWRRGLNEESKQDPHVSLIGNTDSSRNPELSIKLWEGKKIGLNYQQLFNSFPEGRTIYRELFVVFLCASFRTDAQQTRYK